MSAGRPTLYREEYCDQIIEHFTVPPQTVKTKTEYYANGTIKYEEKIPIASEFPTFQSFAHKIDVDMNTLTEWRSVHAEFSLAYARAKELQEHIWLVNGMANLYNSQFAQFFGKNCLGYKDKTESENVTITADVTNLTDEERAARIEELLNK